MLEGLFSSAGHFARDLSDIAHRTTAAAGLLVEILEDPARRQGHIASIRALSKETDVSTHAIQVRVAKTAVTPIDREDLGLLAARLERVSATVERAAWMTDAFRIEASNPDAAHLAQKVAAAAAELEAAVASFKDTPRVTKAAREVKRLEQEGDALYGAAMSALFDGDRDPLDVLRWKELYGQLEEALDDCAHTAGTVEALSLKRL
jgi:uncharacterized protein Yka (UPF0111/DUF47 family)